jgi:predicted GH43/DUF377 family glycosyl hydrolase
VGEAVGWQLDPFTRAGQVLAEAASPTFSCPVTGERVAWAAKDLFNPGAVVRDGMVHLLVRGEDRVGRYAGTSRIGLATSADGLHFELDPEPVLFPGDDRWQSFEWPGGCEDPRIVEAPDGTYVCTYTGFDGKTPHLLVATSPDLRSWTKHGPAFAGTRHAVRASKSGAIVTEACDGRLIACQVGGTYWMYFGEGLMFAATSTDLVRWTPFERDVDAGRYMLSDGGRWALERVPGHPALAPVLAPRRRRFDSLLVEPGPPAVRTADGIVLIFNGVNHWQDGDPSLPPLSYSPCQVLFDAEDPTAVVARMPEPFLRAEGDSETTGQVGNVCFAQGLVLHEGVWRLYYGMADSRVGCATAPARRTTSA